MSTHILPIEVTQVSGPAMGDMISIYRRFIRSLSDLIHIETSVCVDSDNHVYSITLVYGGTFSDETAIDLSRSLTSTFTLYENFYRHGSFLVLVFGCLGEILVEETETSTNTNTNN